MPNLTEARATIEHMTKLNAGPLREVATYTEVLGWYVADLRQMMWILNEKSVTDQTSHIDDVVRLKCQIQQCVNAIDEELAKARKTETV